MFFEEHREDAEFLSPANGFEKVLHPIVYRKDPLTGTACRINVERTRRVKQAHKEIDLSDLAEKSRKTCYFCPENIEVSTPRFPEDIIPGGRILKGETRIFPNLFPFARYHGVGTLTTSHSLDISGFTEKQIGDTISAGLEFFHRISEHDPAARFMTLSWNHLPSSGASVVHPHVQLTGDSHPTNFTDILLKRSREFYEDEGENYWKELVEQEQEKGVRYIGTTGSIHYLASYAPLGNTEVIMVFDGASTPLDLGEKDVTDLAGGLKNILMAYDSLGKKSFNITTYSGPVGIDVGEYFHLSMRIISRPTPVMYYTSDSGFMEALHHERVVESMPEAVAQAIRGFF